MTLNSFSNFEKNEKLTTINNQSPSKLGNQILSDSLFKKTIEKNSKNEKPNSTQKRFAELFKPDLITFSLSNPISFCCVGFAHTIFFSLNRVFAFGDNMFGQCGVS